MIEFRKTSEFSKGTLYNQLVDAYSFNDKCKKAWDASWKEYDGFFPPDSTILIVSKILTEDNASFKELVEEYPGIETFNRDGVIDQGTLDSIETIIDFIDKEGGF